MKKALLALVAIAVVGVAATATLTSTRAAGELANEQFTPASVDIDTAQTTTLSFDATNGVEDGGTIFVDVPDALNATVNSADITAPVTGSMTGTDVLSYTLSGSSVAAGETVSIDLDMDIAAASGGVYSFAIYTEDASDAVVDEGSALLSVENTVAVSAEVLEAIIMNLDKNAINLQADPAVNGGEVDSTESNTFTISSNAAGGFDVQQEMPTALTGSTHSATIDNDTTGENIFAYNLGGSGAESAFSSTAGTTGITDQTADEVDVTDLGGSLGKVGEFEDTIHYYLNIDFSTPADTYDGAITYTIVPTF